MQNLYITNAFLVSQAVGNLVKSLGSIQEEDALNVYQKQFKRLVEKGDFQKTEDCPGEVADCLIAILWLAQLQNIELPPIDGTIETQESISDWCDEHYPGQGLSQRTKDLIEELTELSVCSGVSENEGENSLKAAFKNAQTHDLIAAYNNALHALENYATAIGIKWDKALDAKMAINREKTTAQSQARLAAKAEATKE